MISVTLYTRTDCHLCEQAHQDLASLQAEIPHQLVIVDVDSSKELQRAYGFEVPVVEAGPYKLRAPFGLQELRITVSAAIDRQRQIDELENSELRSSNGQYLTWTSADQFANWASHHYLTLFNLFVIIYLGLPFLAPVLMKVGIPAPAAFIYKAYGTVCHQYAFRSFFLFGNQIIYPREAALVNGVISFNQATKLAEDNGAQNLLAARQYIGDDQIGYKVALCQRDVAIYASILLFGLVFGITGRRLPALPWFLWVLLGLLPIAWDGLSQLISQPPLSFWEYRESTPYLRVLTGALFGFMTAWFGYPMVEETMRDTRDIMERKRRRIDHAVRVN